MSKREELAELTGQPVPPSEQLFSIEPIEDTPFTVVSDGSKEFLALGKYRLTEQVEVGTASKFLESNFWDILLKVVSCVLTEIQNHENAKANPNNSNRSAENTDQNP